MLPLHLWRQPLSSPNISISPWPHFYQTRSAWSVDQGSNKNHSPAYNFAPTVTKFCVMWEGLSLPHDTKLGNCRCKIVDSRAFPSWSLIHGLRWSGLIKAEPGQNGCHFADDLFRCIFVYEKFCIWFNSNFTEIDPRSPSTGFDNGRPLSGPMLTSWPTHICDTRGRLTRCHQNTVKLFYLQFCVLRS